MGVGGEQHAPAVFTPGKDPVPIVREAEGASEPVWISAENLAPTGIRSPDRPARDEPLYRLRHPGSYFTQVFHDNAKWNICSDLQLTSEATTWFAGMFFLAEIL